MQQAKPINLQYLLLILLTSILFSTACKPKLTKNEAEKQLRAFDNEIILIAQRSSETQAYQSLQQMIKIKNLPLPFQYNAADAEPGKPYTFDFESKKGVYSYNKAKNELFKSAPSDSIILVFPYASEKDSVARFVISAYEEQLSAWNILFPIKLDAKMIIANRTMLDARCSGEIQHGFPVNYKVDVTFSNFKLNSTLQTNLSRKRGKVKILTNIHKEQKVLLKNDANLVISMDENKQIVFSSIKSTIEVFPIFVELEIDNKNIAANSTHFIDDFNENASILIYGNQRKRLLGKVNLKDRPNNNRLNVAVTYNDGSVDYLDDFLFTIEKLLNVKL